MSAQPADPRQAVLAKLAQREGGADLVERVSRLDGGLRFVQDQEQALVGERTELWHELTTVHGLTLKEVGDLFGVSATRVLTKLRERSGTPRERHRPREAGESVNHG